MQIILIQLSGYLLWVSIPLATPASTFETKQQSSTSAKLHFRAFLETQLRNNALVHRCYVVQSVHGSWAEGREHAFAMGGCKIFDNSFYG
jgi:hypothetical protein